MKPNKLIEKRIKQTKINDYIIKRIEVDLRHINYGLDSNKNYNKKKRSSFSIDDVADFFESLNEVELDVYSDELYDYFVVDRQYFKGQHNYKMVFCIEHTEPTTSGIITLYQISKEE